MTNDTDRLYKKGIDYYKSLMPKAREDQFVLIKVARHSIWSIKKNTNLLILVKTLKIPIKKVAIELNQQIVDKKKLDKINLKKNDKLEIVHFIGGG